MLGWSTKGAPPEARIVEPPAPPAPPAPPPSKLELITEAEVAERLRCSVSKVRKLRYVGKLAFIPGRPVLVTEYALAEYLAEEARNRPAKGKGRTEAVEETEQPARLSGATRARLLWLRRRMQTGAKT